MDLPDAHSLTAGNTEGTHIAVHEDCVPNLGVERTCFQRVGQCWSLEPDCSAGPTEIVTIGLKPERLFMP